MDTTLVSVNRYFQTWVALETKRKGKRRKLRRWVWLMYLLYMNEYRIFKPVKNIIRRGLRQKREKWRRWTNSDYNAYIHGNITRKLPVWGVGTSRRREDMGKRHRKMNMLPILCTHVCKWKSETCWNYSRNEGEERG
jgi:hypothetical protein